MNKVYTGIGSRDVTKEEENMMYALGKYLGARSYTLRSGKTKQEISDWLQEVK